MQCLLSWLGPLVYAWVDILAESFLAETQDQHGVSCCCRGSVKCKHPNLWMFSLAKGQWWVSQSLILTKRAHILTDAPAQMCWSQKAEIWLLISHLKHVLVVFFNVFVFSVMNLRFSVLSVNTVKWTWLACIDHMEHEVLFIIFRSVAKTLPVSYGVKLTLICPV